jgi:hypothetical protein
VGQLDAPCTAQPCTGLTYFFTTLGFWLAIARGAAAAPRRLEEVGLDDGATWRPCRGRGEREEDNRGGA